MSLKHHYHKNPNKPYKVHPFSHFLGGPLVTFAPPPPSQPEPKKAPAKSPEPPIDRAKLKAEAIAEFLAEQKAKEEAEKTKKAEEVKKAEEAKKKREEDRARHHELKAKRKAERQARRDAIAWTVLESKKVFAMHKEGKSWEDISKELTNDANPNDVERHYNTMKELYTPPAQEKESEKNKKTDADNEGKEKEKGAIEAGQGKSHGEKNGNGKDQSDEEKVDVAKKAEVQKTDQIKTRGGGGGFSSSFSKKDDNKLTGMKKGNKSWKEIVDALGNGRTIKDAKNRWKELNNSTDSEDSGPSKKNSSTTDEDDGGLLGIFGGDNSGDDADESSQASSPSTKTSKKGENKGEKKEEKKQEPRELQPDSFWSEEDCRILEVLLLKHEEQKMLTIQNGFAMLTGRMVAISMLKAKLAELKR